MEEVIHLVNVNMESTLPGLLVSVLWGGGEWGAELQGEGSLCLGLTKVLSVIKGGKNASETRSTMEEGTEGYLEKETFKKE